MSNALSTFLGAAGALTKPTDFAKALSGHVRTAAPASVDGSFLKLHTDGFWCYGAAEDRIAEDSVFAVNPMSLQVGYCAWRDMVKIEEHMAPIGADVIVVENLPQDLGVHTKPKERAGQKVGYDPQIAVAVQGVEGSDQGLKLVYNTTSHGGRSVITGLMEEVSKRAEQDPEFFIPLVRLGLDSYYNKSYNKTVYTPQIEVVGWGNVNGQKAPDTTPKRRQRAKSAPMEETRRRRRVAA